MEAVDWLVKWLEEERQRQRLSQRDVEDRGGLSRGTISRTLKKGSVPDTDTLQRWARALGYDPATVLTILIGKPTDVQISNMREKFQRLSAQDRRYILDNMQLLLRRQQQQKHKEDAEAAGAQAAE